MAKPERKPARKPVRKPASKPAPKGARRAKPRPDDGTPQVGRRPSPPALLFVVAASWIAAGIVVFVAFTASWKLIPGVVFIGIGLLYLRAALTTVARRSD